MGEHTDMTLSPFPLGETPLKITLSTRKSSHYSVEFFSLVIINCKPNCVDVFMPEDEWVHIQGQ